MKGERLFAEYYEPGLIRQGIENVVLRTYTHIHGLATDDPDNSTELTFMPRSEVDGRMERIHAAFGEDRGIAITSIVSHGAQLRYLFLLDCALSISDQNEQDLLDDLGRLGHDHIGRIPPLRAFKDAMVLRTVQSYHVVSFVPLSLEEWQRHMAYAILHRTRHQQAIADVRYIGHSLERAYGSLRMSDYQGKPTPDFICYIPG